VSALGAGAVAGAWTKENAAGRQGLLPAPGQKKTPPGGRGCCRRPDKKNRRREEGLLPAPEQKKTPPGGRAVPGGGA